MRRPSGEKSFSRQLSEGSSGPPSLPKPKKLTRKWSNQSETSVRALDQSEASVRTLDQSEEPLYDSVPNEEPEDEYDNHLLYGTGAGASKRPGTEATDTVRSGNSSTAGEEAATGNSLTSMTLSSSTDTENLSGSPSLMRRVVTMEEEESNYVNIQYFLHHTKSRTQMDREQSLENGGESEEENETKAVKSPNNNSNSNGGSLGSNKSRDNISNSSGGVGEAERQLMYRHILNR